MLTQNNAFLNIYHTCEVHDWIKAILIVFKGIKTEVITWNKFMQYSTMQWVFIYSEEEGFWKHREKSENAGKPTFCLFPLCRAKSLHLSPIFCHGFINPFPKKPWFLRVCSTSLLKTLWEKEKLLITSNFSFSHSVFSHFWQNFCHFC